MSVDQYRFYEREFPEPNELVMVKVARLEQNMGAYVQLLEYGKMEGLILPSELSKRRYRSITKLIRVGRQEVAIVVRVDTDKGYVDLSKKRVAPEDIAITEESFSKAKKVFLTARQVASHLKIDVMEINRLAIWPLYRKHGHAYDALKMAVEDVETVFAGIDCPGEIRDCLIEDIKARFTPQILRIRGRIHISCTGKRGVLGVKQAIMAGQELADEIALGPTKFELSVTILAPPLYNALAICMDKTEGLAKTQLVLDRIKEAISAEKGGEFQMQGELTVRGSEEDTFQREGSDEEDSSSSSSNEDESGSEENEDEGMGIVQEDEGIVEDSDTEKK